MARMHMGVCSDDCYNAAKSPEDRLTDVQVV